MQDRLPAAVAVTYLTVPRSVEIKCPSPSLVQGRGEDGPGSGPQDEGNLMGHLSFLGAGCVRKGLNYIRLGRARGSTTNQLPNTAVTASYK